MGLAPLHAVNSVFRKLISRFGCFPENMLFLQSNYSNVVVMNTITIDSNIYRGAEKYAKLHNVNLKKLVEDFLMKLQMPSMETQETELQLPERLEWLGGCLSGVPDDKDERMKFLMEKYFVQRCSL